MLIKDALQLVARYIATELRLENDELGEWVDLLDTLFVDATRSSRTFVKRPRIIVPEPDMYANVSQMDGETFAGYVWARMEDLLLEEDNVECVNEISLATFVEL